MDCLYRGISSAVCGIYGSAIIVYSVLCVVLSVVGIRIACNTHDECNRLKGVRCESNYDSFSMPGYKGDNILLPISISLMALWITTINFIIELTYMLYELLVVSFAFFIV